MFLLIQILSFKEKKSLNFFVMFFIILKFANTTNGIIHHNLLFLLRFQHLFFLLTNIHHQGGIPIKSESRQKDLY